MNSGMKKKQHENTSHIKMNSGMKKKQQNYFKYFLSIMF